MLEVDDCDGDSQNLPQLTSSPRSLVASQPQTARSVRSMNSNSVQPKTQGSPRLTLKQVARGHREWTSGLFECNEDRNICWYSCVCAPIVLWNLGERLGEPSPCMAGWVPGTCSSFRTKIRTVGGIHGSVLTDCCITMWCPCCSVCQMAREVDHMIVQPEVYVRPTK